MKKCLILLLCTAMLTGAAWAQTTHLAYLQGYPDGTLRAERTVTREEFAQIVMRLTDYEPQADAFFDVPPTRWSYRAVCAVTQMGIMEAERGYFNPTEPIAADELSRVLFALWGAELDAEFRQITRGELAHLLNEILHRQPRCAEDLMDGMVLFCDNADASAQYFVDLQEASCAHTYEQTSSGERWIGLG